MMPAVMLFNEDYDVFGESISDQELGETVRALFHYNKTGEVLEGLSPMAASFFRLLKIKQDRQAKKYTAQVENSKKASASRSKNVPSNDPTITQPSPNDDPTITQPSPNDDKPKTKNLKPKTNKEYTGVIGGHASDDAATHTKKFKPPTREEAAAYAQEKGFALDVDRFLDYYGANGWHIGRSAMKDWKRAMNNWARNDYRSRDAPAAKPVPSHGRELESWD